MALTRTNVMILGRIGHSREVGTKERKNGRAALGLVEMKMACRDEIFYIDSVDY